MIHTSLTSKLITAAIRMNNKVFIDHYRFVPRLLFLIFPNILFDD